MGLFSLEKTDVGRSKPSLVVYSAISYTELRFYQGGKVDLMSANL